MNNILIWEFLESETDHRHWILEEGATLLELVNWLFPSAVEMYSNIGQELDDRYLRYKHIHW